MIYLGDRIKESGLSYNQIQEKLMESFNENKLMENFIKTICIVNNLIFNDIWITFVYHIDEQRRINNNDYPSIWKYFIENITDLDEWINNSNLDDSIGVIILELYKKKTKELPKKITSKIGIISLGGINPTKELLKNIIKNINYNYTFRYDTTPYYLFESSTEDSNIESHNEFIKNLEIESQKFSPKIFIKSDFIGKISTL
jgi:translation initiation factor 2 alpha subunit (eIF-2alpha)